MNVSSFPPLDVVADHNPATYVQLSYGRCCASPAFFDDFYDTFTSKSPQIKELFTHTDFVKQKKLLKESLTYVIMYSLGSAVAADQMKKLGQRHGRQGLNIPPQLYTMHLEALIQTIKKHDKKFRPELESMWREVMDNAIRAIHAEQ